MYYAIIALNLREAKELEDKLRKDANTAKIASWLKIAEDNSIYGATPDDWRPFGNDRISDIIKYDSPNYESETGTVWPALSGNSLNLVKLIPHIEVFFVDVFAMYLEKYQKFALKADYGCCDGTKHKCCFVMDHRVPIDVQEQLEMNMKELWQSVSTNYSEGCLHRIAVRVDDLNNFKNYLKILNELKDRPDPKNNLICARKLAAFGEDKPLQKLGRET